MWPQDRWSGWAARKETSQLSRKQRERELLPQRRPSWALRPGAAEQWERPWVPGLLTSGSPVLPSPPVCARMETQSWE